MLSAGYKRPIQPRSSHKLTKKANPVTMSPNRLRSSSPLSKCTAFVSRLGSSGAVDPAFSFCLLRKALILAERDLRSSGLSSCRSCKSCFVDRRRFQCPCHLVVEFRQSYGCRSCLHYRYSFRTSIEMTLTIDYRLPANEDSDYEIVWHDTSLPWRSFPDLDPENVGNIVPEILDSLFLRLIETDIYQTDI